MVLLGQAARREVVVELIAMPTVVVAKPEKVAKPVAKPALQLAKPVASGTKAYYLGRLEREHPQIAKRVQDGELSVHAASVAAGLRKAPAKSKWTTIDAYVSKKVDA